MDSSDRDNLPVTFDNVRQGPHKPIEDCAMHDYRRGSQEGISRSSSFSVLVDGGDLDVPPISPLSISPSPSIRADDNMSESSFLSPWTPTLEMSPATSVPQKSPLRELESPSLSPTKSDLSFDPFIQSSTVSKPELRNDPSATVSKPGFRTKAKGLSFILPSICNYRSGQSPGLLDAVRQQEVSPLPSPLARDLRRRVEVVDDEDHGMDITAPFEEHSILSAHSVSTLTPSEESCLGLDLGLGIIEDDTKLNSNSYFSTSYSKSQGNSFADDGHGGEHIIVGPKIMKASKAHSSSAELIPSPNNSQARQQHPVSNRPSSHENFSRSSTKKYPRRSIPLPPPHLQPSFASVPISELNRGAYMPSLQTLPLSVLTPGETVSKRDNWGTNLPLSPSVGKFRQLNLKLSTVKSASVPRELSASDLLRLQIQGVSRFPKYFPEGYLLEASFARQYCLETELGSGGYGFVLGARNVYTNAQVAVKFINRRLVPTRGLIRDYKNDIVPLEAVVLQLAEHPGVVRFYGLYEDAVYFYLVQELHGSPWSKNVKNKHKLGQEHVDISDESSPVDVTKAKSISPYAPVHSSPLRPLAASNSMPSIPTMRRMSSSSAQNEIPLGPRGSLPLSATRPQMPRRASYDLFECIEQHERLSEGQAKYIFAQVAETVWYLDSIGITHRDIKDENLVIDREFKVKFIDFGSAVIRDVRKPPPTYNTFFGTVTFASPDTQKPAVHRPAGRSLDTRDITLIFGNWAEPIPNHRARDARGNV
ncbi:Protein tyrosine kinase [Rhizoctonia solani]|uniref:Protein tyrosine kinase n=1 Tax=Rhizoctonia solani TaxID=456999 RepID=A0A8H7H5E8_9AGAM|nr:Protein tyrosine kinase [Rhizoctonia solani]